MWRPCYQLWILSTLETISILHPVVEWCTFLAISGDFRFSSEVTVAALLDFFMLSCCSIFLPYRFLLVFIAHVCFQPDRFEGMPRYLSRLLGPSDDSLDCIVRGCYLPELSIGDWILFSKMGAYAMTGSLASLDDYELARPKCHYTMCARDW